MVGTCDVLNSVDEVIGCCCGTRGRGSVSCGKRTKIGDGYTKEFRCSRHFKRDDIGLVL